MHSSHICITQTPYTKTTSSKESFRFSVSVVKQVDVSVGHKNQPFHQLSYVTDSLSFQKATANWVHNYFVKHQILLAADNYTVLLTFTLQYKNVLSWSSWIYFARDQSSITCSKFIIFLDWNLERANVPVMELDSRLNSWIFKDQELSPATSK